MPFIYKLASYYNLKLRHLPVKRGLYICPRDKQLLGNFFFEVTYSWLIFEHTSF